MAPGARARLRRKPSRSCAIASASIAGIPRSQSALTMRLWIAALAFDRASRARHCWLLQPRARRQPRGRGPLCSSAARSGDRASVYQRLGPETRARIEAMLSSSRHQGGRLIARPEDFFSVGWAPPAWEPAGMRTVQRDRERAEVEIYSAAGDRHSLTLVREGKEWKIELPGS
jgi:hypothetical protein